MTRIVEVLAATAATFTAFGCLAPRSAVLGQTASALGPGGTEAALSMGALYQSQRSVPGTTTDEQGRTLTTQEVARGFAFPAIEADVGLGVTESIGFSLHASPAGLRPGMKMTLWQGRGALALMPHVGLGYGSSASSTYVTGIDGRLSEVQPAVLTTFIWSAGLKVMASHRSGVYGGAGYEIQSVTNVTAATSGVGGATTPTESRTGSIQHNASMALGFEVKLERSFLRPEIAVVLTPLIYSSTSDLVGRVVNEGGGGFSWMVMPTITVAVGHAGSTSRGDQEDDEQLRDE